MEQLTHCSGSFGDLVQLLLTNITGGQFEDTTLSILVNATCVATQGFAATGTYSTTFLGRSYGEGKFTFFEQSAHL